MAMGVEVPEVEGTAAAKAARRRAAALGTLRGNLSVSPVRGSRLVAVGYDNPNPVVAARIANGFAENFIQSNLDRKFESSSYAREFLEERIAQTKERLESAERQLVAYAANQQIINVGEPSEGATSGGATESLTSNNLVAINAALARTRAERVAAEERWRSGNQARAAPEKAAAVWFDLGAPVGERPGSASKEKRSTPASGAEPSAKLRGQFLRHCRNNLLPVGCAPDLQTFGVAPAARRAP